MIQFEPISFILFSLFLVLYSFLMGMLFEKSKKNKKKDYGIQPTVPKCKDEKR